MGRISKLGLFCPILPVYQPSLYGIKCFKRDYMCALEFSQFTPNGVVPDVSMVTCLDDFDLEDEKVDDPDNDDDIRLEFYDDETQSDTDKGIAQWSEDKSENKFVKENSYDPGQDVLLLSLKRYQEPVISYFSETYNVFKLTLKVSIYSHFNFPKVYHNMMQFMLFLV